MITRNKEWIDVAAKLHEIKEKIAFLEQEESKLSTQLKELSEHKDSCGGGFEYKTTERLGSVNYKDIPELKDIDLSPYRKDSVSSWRLTLKKQFKEILWY